jgi:hypothetical protein
MAATSVSSILVESPTLWIYSIAIGILLGDLAYSRFVRKSHDKAGNRGGGGGGGAKEV